MKKSKFILILCIFFIACDFEFIPDPVNFKLPRYTEQGVNTYGAYFNDGLWRGKGGSSSFKTFFKSNPSENTLKFQLDGYSGPESNPESFSRIEFHLNDIKADSAPNLLNLSGRKIELDGVNNSVYFIEENALNDDELLNKARSQSGTGQLFFRKVQDVYGDIYLSGTFGFDINSKDCKNISLTFGRFDIKVPSNGSGFTLTAD